MDKINRDRMPLSPHLTIYRPQNTSILSIFHRLTGIGLFFPTLIMVMWIISIPLGPYYFGIFQGSPKSQNIIFWYFAGFSKISYSIFCILQGPPKYQNTIFWYSAGFPKISKYSIFVFVSIFPKYSKYQNIKISLGIGST